MALRLFDVHAHYQDPAFDGDRNDLFLKMHAGGIAGIVDSGDSPESSVKCLECSEKYDFVYATAGIHPLNIEGTTDEDINKIRELLQHPKAVAVGEIGLDYYYDNAASKEVQQYWALKLIELAAETKKPIVFHDRDAHEDSLKMLKKAASMGVTGILHCFSGSVEMMREAVRLDFSISLGGVVTFKNAKKAVEATMEVPLDKLLLETDSPYLTPVPFRGKRNNSSLISYTADRIAEIRGIETEEMCNIIYENSIRMFKI